MSNPIIIVGDNTHPTSKNVKYKRRCNTCNKPYVGWGKLYCSGKCRKQPTGEASPSWKGDNITDGAGRSRALRMFKLKSCEICKSPKSERHHIDGDPTNNSRKNIMFLCRKHHFAIDKRAKRIAAIRLGRLES